MAVTVGDTMSNTVGLFGTVRAIGIVALTTALVSACSSDTAGAWKHETHQDEMTDQKQHGLHTHGTTKEGNTFYFSFVCLGAKSTALFYNNGSSISGNVGEPQVVQYRIGSDPANRSFWDIKYRFGFGAGDSESLRQLGRQSVEEQDADRALVRLSGTMPSDDPMCEGCTSYVRVRDGTIETQEPDVVLGIMSGLAAGQEVVIQYEGDVARIAPDKLLATTYPEIRDECGY